MSINFNILFLLLSVGSRQKKKIFQNLTKEITDSWIKIKKYITHNIDYFFYLKQMFLNIKMHTRYYTVQIPMNIRYYYYYNFPFESTFPR